MKIEIAANSLTSALAAYEAGADRIELCANLELGGTTPGPGTLIATRKQLKIPIHALIRPRGGDFVYSDTEMEEIVQSIEFCRQLGIEGIVIGCLTPAGKVDVSKTQRILEHTAGMDLTFHRAFDLVTDQEEALETIIELGFHRILTSGGKNSTPEGAKQIARLIEKAGNRITIMPGGGINNNNITDIAEFTGAAEFHLSCKTVVKSPMEYRPRHLELINMQDIHAYDYMVSHEDKIRDLVRKIRAKS